jgi:hypothetical protein
MHMRTLMKYYKKFLAALAVEIVVIILVNLPNKLGGTLMCPSGGTVCKWGWTLALIVLVPLIAIVIWGSVEKRFRPIIQRKNQRDKAQKQKVFTLTESDKNSNEVVCLKLCNRLVRPSVDIRQIEVGNGAIIFSRREESFLLEIGKCREIQFLQVSKHYKRFSIVDDLKEPDFSEFKPGKHNFDIAVVYDNGSIQWFVVKVIYIEPDKITLEIPDD